MAPHRLTFGMLGRLNPFRMSMAERCFTRKTQPVQTLCLAVFFNETHGMVVQKREPQIGIWCFSCPEGGVSKLDSATFVVCLRGLRVFDPINLHPC